jgi:hypothetical protein
MPSGIVREAERTRMDARAGALLQGWLLHAHFHSDAEVMDQHLIHLRQYPFNSGPIAQRLVQKTHNLLVPGSNPGGPTKLPSRGQHSRPCFNKPGMTESCCMPDFWQNWQSRQSHEFPTATNTQPRHPSHARCPAASSEQRLGAHKRRLVQYAVLWSGNAPLIVGEDAPEHFRADHVNAEVSGRSECVSLW